MNQPTAHFYILVKPVERLSSLPLRIMLTPVFTQSASQRGHVALTKFPKGEPFFFNLRNPITRFTSAFYSRKLKPATWNQVESELFARFRTPNELVEALCEKDPLAQRGMRGE